MWSYHEKLDSIFIQRKRNWSFSGLVSKSINRWFDLIDETQLYIIANSDLTMDYPKPLFPNVISVEGLSASDAKPLPEGT